jgi:hypothetical protein
MSTRLGRSGLGCPLVIVALAVLPSACAKTKPAAQPPDGTSAGTPAVMVPSSPSTRLEPALAATVNEALEAALASGARPPAQSLSGSIVLPRRRQGDVHKGETIFIAVRRAGGPPGPGSLLAAQRREVDEFPLAFTLSERDAMVEGAHLDGLLSITVRVDKDGDPLTHGKGDVYGRIERLRADGHDVVVSLDTLQEKDEELEGRGMIPAPGSERTAALPPGHPPLDDAADLDLPPAHP